MVLVYGRNGLVHRDDSQAHYLGRRSHRQLLRRDDAVYPLDQKYTATVGQVRVTLFKLTAEQERELAKLKRQCEPRQFEARRCDHFPCPSCGKYNLRWEPKGLRCYSCRATFYIPDDAAERAYKRGYRGPSIFDLMPWDATNRYEPDNK